MLYDWTHGSNSQRLGRFELKPGWQDITLPWALVDGTKQVEGITIKIVLGTAVNETEFFFQADVDNIAFHYVDGRTQLVAGFETIPLGVKPIPMHPEGFVLYQNYPNPFNPITRISVGSGGISRHTCRV